MQPQSNIEDNGLVYGFVLDGHGRARSVNLDKVQSWTPQQGILWLHFDINNENAKRWIRENGGLDHVAAEYILETETRPRSLVVDDSILVVLRGVNLNPESDPEDMVSIRVWLDRYKIISTRIRTLLSVKDIVESFDTGSGPETCGEFIVTLAERLTSRMKTTVSDIEEKMDSMEEQIVSKDGVVMRSDLANLRRQSILLRRYLAPQREALSRLYIEKTELLNDNERMSLHELTNQLIRYIEELDAVRERAAVIHEELLNRRSEEMNKRMYVLSIVAAIFLPLGFLTGLLGINVGGIPGADSNIGFSVFTALLVVVVVLQLLVFKWKKWF